jgi:hypothetical protein
VANDLPGFIRVITARLVTAHGAPSSIQPALALVDDSILLDQITFFVRGTGY